MFLTLTFLIKISEKTRNAVKLETPKIQNNAIWHYFPFSAFSEEAIFAKKNWIK